MTRAYLLTRPMCSACAEAQPIKGWLAMRGVEVVTYDVSTAAGLAGAAWLELADLDLVPVLVLVDDERGEICRYIGSVPPPAELRRVLMGLD